MWKSSVEAGALLKNMEEVDRLKRCYGMASFWQSAIPAADYSANSDWASFPAFLPAGQEVMQALRGVEEEFGQPTFNLALFGIFFHTDLLIDWRSTDVEGIFSIFAAEVRSEKLRFPNRFGRALYDRFNDRYEGTRTDHLLAEDVRLLLEGAPQGVYQSGHLLVGPLGALTSEEVRFKPFRNSVPLWHCSDTGCQAVHSVKLDRPAVPFVRARREIRRQLGDAFGRPSEWDTVLSKLNRPSDTYEQDYADLLETVAQCTVGTERTVLVAAALRGPEESKLREVIAASRKRKDLDAPAETIAARLSPEEQLQLLMLLTDAQLVETIDDAILKRDLRIPLGEIRYSAQSFVLSSQNKCELSILGIRSERERRFLISSLAFGALTNKQTYMVSLSGVSEQTRRAARQERH